MNQNDNKPMTAEDILDELYTHVNKDINDDMAWDTALKQIDHYAAQQVKQVTEERDEMARLISESPLCDTVVDPKLQRAWEACCTLCEKAEFKFMFKYMQDLEKKVKRVTEERDKAVQLLKSARELFDRPETDQYANSDVMHLIYNEIAPFLNSLNAAKEGGE